MRPDLGHFSDFRLKACEHPDKQLKSVREERHTCALHVADWSVNY
jgi:hypothetical protein